jgi:hypothetical protein
VTGEKILVLTMVIRPERREEKDANRRRYREPGVAGVGLVAG